MNQNTGTNRPMVTSLVIALALVTLAAQGEGFRNPPPDSFSLGRSGGRITHIDSAAAVQQNPANLTAITDIQAELTPSIVWIHADYSSAAGTAETTDPWKLLPNAYVAVPLNDSGLVAGLGVTTPYGISSEWKQEGAFANPAGLRYLYPWYTELKTINVNPSIAVRISDSFSLGAGLDVMWSELTFKQFYPWFPWGSFSEGNVKAQGDGVGIGGNFGLTWQVAEGHRISVTYRSPVSIDYDGDFEIDNIPAAAAGAGVTSQSDFSSQIKFPTIIAVGYGVDVTHNLRLEVAGEWIQFSNFKSLDIDAANNNILLPSTSIPQNWEDTFTVGIGGDWKLAERWALRFGYQHYQSPVPDSTLSPTIPDADQNVFTIGLGYAHGHHSLEVAYGLDFYDKRTVASGTYDINVHLMSAAYRFSF